MVTVLVLNQGRTKSRILQACLREICYICAVLECEIKAVHIEGAENRIPDFLSRWHLDKFYQNQFTKFIAGKPYKEIKVHENFFRFQHNW